MTKREKDKIIKMTETWSDQELEEKYYESVFDCLGSECEKMYERGYDIVDIKEREKYEKWLCDYSDILEDCCIKRGIKIWE